ncbi:MAG: SPOR domain-containing protein [Gammaproteobacteria bacterium]|nr:SPOR domain-containing protein [Gammaproteobacteria bacterium]MDH5799807.1 SPOR domain-containing protein [Gammaproteobacteria bacterium]
MKPMQMNRGYAKPVSLGIWLFALLALSGFSALIIYMDQYEKGQLTETKSIDVKKLIEQVGSIKLDPKVSQDKTAKAPETKQTPIVRAEQGPPEKKQPTETKGAKQTFDFYSLLPEMEVVVPESDLLPLRIRPVKPTASENASTTVAVDKTENTLNSPNPDISMERDRVLAPVKPGSNLLSAKSDRIHSYFIQAGAFKDIKLADRRKANLALMGIKSSIVSVDLKRRGVWHRVRVGPFADVEKMGRVRSLLKSNNISSITVKVKS